MIWTQVQMIPSLSFQIKSFVQGAAFGSPKDLSIQLAMDAMDQLYGHKGGNLNVLEK